EPLSDAVTLVAPLNALILATICAALSVLRIVLMFWPLSTNVPLTPPVGKVERSVEPVATAGASGSSVAPEPMTCAACGGTASGFASKKAGLSSSDPSTLVLKAGVIGLLARFALY